MIRVNIIRVVGIIINILGFYFLLNFKMEVIKYIYFYIRGEIKSLGNFY